ncbi:TetR/AcrR family transcriptional regulator [Alkalihalobacterium elongatum]|uniref:TetR/AcrR family transcriptional regulator n=1 Tax=Alkalihalobacterium elongatum TaxID=2675466 RepID=UPI001C1FA2E1|nr:TetR/AcrR family transcriptional regulator [Alkalihalobacterium elongatum]
MKEKIFEKSIELFGERGFNETSIQHIVDALGVTKGTFYYYFKSKEEILLGIHLRFIDDLLAKQSQIIHDGNKSCEQKLYEIVYMLIKNVETQAQSARVFFREMQNLSEGPHSQIFPKRDEFRLNLQRLIEDGIAKGEFRKEIQADIVTLGILGMCNWSYHWFDPQGPLTDQTVAKIYMDMILQGIKTD